MVEPLPFDQLFRPLVAKASDRLREHVSVGFWNLLAPEARAGWEHYLLVRLTSAGAKSAYWQFQVFKTVREFIPARPPKGGPMQDDLYREFVGKQPAERLRTLFAEFPVLADLCAFIIENWIATVAEFLGRLEANRLHFGGRFLVSGFEQPVAAIEAGLSDPHRGGRCVVRITSCTGATLIYKPRSLAAERMFFDLLSHLNTVGVPHPMRGAVCWDCGEYGWMEDVIPRPCQLVADVRSFYWRCGVLLGLIYLSRGVDFHCENLVATGDCPVLIDLETLWHPQELAGQFTNSFTKSVLRTGFLPQPNPQLGKTYGWSALSRSVQSECVVPGWTDTNQDKMAWAATTHRLKSCHLPELAGQRQTATQFIVDIQAGFRWVGERLLSGDDREVMLKQWLGGLTRCRRRLVLRSSATYHAIIAQLTLPQYLRRDKKGAVALPDGGLVKPLEYTQENQALLQLEIPYFEQAKTSVESRTASCSWTLSKRRYLGQISKIAESLEGKTAA